MSRPVVVVGGGVNGLVCATLLARAGRSVTVLERRAALGGLSAGEEFHPGFRHAGAHLDTWSLREDLVRELDLEGHGLQWRDREPEVVVPDPDGGAPVVRRPDDVEATAEALAGHDPADAAALRTWSADVGRLAGFLRRVLDEPPPDVDARTPVALWELLRKALALRRLGRRDMSELLHVGPMAVADALEERFATDRWKLLLATPAVAGTWTTPWSAGSALQLLLAEASRSRSVRGGPAAVVGALTSAAEAAGVTLRTGAEVDRLLVDGGRVLGVRLRDGEDVEAAAVAASCDPRQLFLDLVRPRELPPVLGRRALAWRVRGTTAVVHLALDAPPAFSGCEDRAVERAVLGRDLRDLELAFQPMKYSKLPERPVLDVVVRTHGRPELAPDGKHVATVHAHFVPHALAGGWTDARRDELRERVLAAFERFAPGVTGSVLAADVLSPADLEARYRLTGGHLHHGEHALDQMLHLRPAPECSRGATPIAGLFLCGSGSHPGGGVTGVPGALGARAVRGKR